MTAPKPEPTTPPIAADQVAEGKKPEAVPPKLYARGSWLRERDGDLNPTWIFVSIYLVVGVIACLAAVRTGNPIAIGGALSFLATIIIALLMSALPIAKSKVLARARLGETAITGEPAGDTKPGVD